jgi:hypothetical protein
MSRRTALLLLATLGAINAHHEGIDGICSWEQGEIGYCQSSAQGQCSTDKSFVIPRISDDLYHSYCTDRGYCCFEVAKGLKSRPPRGKSCEDVGKISLPGCNGPTLNWCRALKSATVSTALAGGESSQTFAQCQEVCAATAGCDGFDFSLNPTLTNGKVCQLITQAVPYYGDALEVTPEDSTWVTWINSYHGTCEDSAPAWYDLNLELRTFTRGHEGYHAVAGDVTVLTETSDLSGVVSQIIDNLYLYKDGQVVRLQASSADKRAAYAAELEASLRDKLKVSHATFQSIAWTTPSAQFPSFTTYAVVIRDFIYESMLAATFTESLGAAAKKFRPLNHIPPEAVSQIFRDAANQKVATFAAAVACPEDGGCIGGSACLLNNGLCKCRSHYEVQCVDYPFTGCYMKVVFLATCGNPDIEWVDSSFEYKVSGFGFTAWQQGYELGKECECAPVTSK